MNMRKLDTSKFQFQQHKSLSSFLSQKISPGAHEINLGKQNLHLLYKSYNSPTTLIVFHGALPETAHTFPVLQGQGIAEQAQTNLISIADPSIAMGVNLGWHLGNRIVGDLESPIVSVLQHLLGCDNPQKVIFFGASGGAHPALHYGSIISLDSKYIILANPRITLEDGIMSSVEDYFQTCWGSNQPRMVKAFKSCKLLQNSRPDNLVIDAGEFAIKSETQNIFVYQNLEDDLYLNTQTIPFLRKALEAQLQTFFYFAQDGAGHIPMPKTELVSMIENIQFSNFTETKFRTPKEALLDALAAFPQRDSTARKLIRANRKLQKQNHELKNRNARLKRSVTRLKDQLSNLDP